MTHEDFVSFEQAKALKELGFDWECQAYFEDYLDELNRHHRKFRFNAAANDMLHKDFCTAPNLAQAQKWLREVKGIEVCAHADFEGGFPNGKWLFYFRKLSDNVLDTGFDYKPYDSYELALSAGIDEALELLKENNNGK